MASDFSALAERITAAAKRTSLTDADLRLVDLVLADPHTVAFAGAAEVAQNCGSSAATVVRSARRLGFEGFADLQGAVRSEIRRSNEATTAAERIREGTDNVGTAAVLVGAESLTAVVPVVQSDTFAQAVDLVSDLTRTVNLIGGHEAAGIGRLASDRLSALRPSVAYLSGSETDLSYSILDLTRGDVVVACDLSRHDRWLTDAARLAASSGATVIAITDSAAGALAKTSSLVLMTSTGGAGPFDTHIGMLGIIEALVASVADRLRSSAQARLEHLEAIWRASGAIIA